MSNNKYYANYVKNNTNNETNNKVKYFNNLVDRDIRKESLKRERNKMSNNSHQTLLFSPSPPSPPSPLILPPATHRVDYVQILGIQQPLSPPHSSSSVFPQCVIINGIIYNVNPNR